MAIETHPNHKPTTKAEHSERYARFWRFVGMAGAAVLLAAFLLTLLGVVDLRIVSDLDTPRAVDYSIRTALFLGNMYFVFCISLDGKRHIAALLAFMPLHVFFDWVLPGSFIVSTGIPAVYLILFCLGAHMDPFPVLRRHVALLVIAAIYQQISGFIKIQYLGFGYVSVPTALLSIYSIDLFLFLLFCKEVFFCEQKAKLLAGRPGGKLAIYPQAVSVRLSRQRRFAAIPGYKALAARQKAAVRVLASAYEVFQLLVVLSIGIINSMAVELPVMLLMFWAGRPILGASWHSGKLWVCSCVTFSGFYVLTKVAPPFEVSLFLTIALSAAFVWLLHLAGIKAERLEILEERFAHDFTRFGLSPEMAAFAYDYKVLGLSLKAQAEKSGFPIDTVRRYRTRVNRAIKDA